MSSTVILIFIIVGVLSAFYILNKADQNQIKQYEKEQQRIAKIKMEWYNKGVEIRGKKGIRNDERTEEKDRVEKEKRMVGSNKSDNLRIKKTAPFIKAPCFKN